jgi:hypothetical protein
VVLAATRLDGSGEHGAQSRQLSCVSKDLRHVALGGQATLHLDQQFRGNQVGSAAAGEIYLLPGPG